MIVWKYSHDHGCTGRVLDISHPDLNEIALSNMKMLETLDLLTTGSVPRSCTLSFPLSLRPIAVGDVLRVLDPQPISWGYAWFHYVRLS